MPCGRSGFWRGRSFSRPAARAPASNAPSRPASSAPPPAPVQKGNGFGAAIVDGIGWGVGTAMAHRAVDAIVGPCVIKHETVASSEPAAAAAPTPKPNTNNLMNSDAWVINPKL
ncbi:HVA22-like protein a, putative isoform 1 [Hibiscus syriacus]|uniref:HVA22-like protein a, putative isoform 1 n=1 Tax=Hibiscus syriacus TaxID=106335 RepID=A0A6A3AAZ2_HIBSY|nr:HVA22-like protein a, putative isoform 1 [Hibiscus syriacus]